MLSSAPLAPTHPRYHDERMINYDTDRGVSVTNDAEGSTLTVENASAAADSGNYTCSPYNIRPSWVVVHVLSKGNSAAAVQVRKSAFSNHQSDDFSVELKKSALSHHHS